MNTNAPSFSKLSRAALRLTGATRLLAALGGLAGAPAILEAQLNITRQPTQVVVTSGQTASFSVGVTANPEPTYQWRRFGQPIAGATAASYQIPQARQFDNDFYDVEIQSGTTTALSQSARLIVAPPSYPGALTLDLARSWRLEGPENSTIYSPTFGQAVLPDGRFYLSGRFSNVNGQARPHLARFNANGTVDTSFTPPSFDAQPIHLALQPDGKLLVGGIFKTVGGAPAGGLVRLNSDGSRDATFNAGPGFTNGLHGRIFVTPSGTIYITDPAFVIIRNGVPSGNIVRLTANGAVDPTFTSPTFSFGNGTTNPNGFAMGPAGEIYVYGNFTAVNGVARSRLARLSANGDVDPSFNPGSGPNTYVYVVIALSNGQLAIGGDFTAYNGTAAGHIARINANGSLDTTFVSGSGFSQQVGFLAEMPGNAILVGSSFNTLNGTNVGPLVRLTASGALDTSFVWSQPYRPDALSVLPDNRLLASGPLLVEGRSGARLLESNGTLALGVTQPELRFPAHVRLLAPLPGGKVLVAGDFTSVDGQAVPYVMRLNADLSRDTTFPAGRGPTAQVVTGLVQPDGKIVLFTYNGILRLNADGSTDSSFNALAPGGFIYPVPPVMLPDGRIFVPTSATFWVGAAVTNGVVVLEPNGTRTTAHPFLPGPNAGARITGMQRVSGGKLLVTGSFTSWNGVPRQQAVRLNSDGTVDATFVPDGRFPFNAFQPSFAPNGWSLQRSGKSIIFSESSNDLSRLNVDGSLDPSFVSGLPRMSPGVQLLVQADDRLVVCGQEIFSFGGELKPSFLRLGADGGIDPSFVVRGSGSWQTAMIADNGELLSSDDTGYLHRYKPLPAPSITTPPATQFVVAGTTVVLRVTATGDDPFAYQWTKDGAPISGATGSSLTIDSASPLASGSYAVVVANAGGSVTSPAAMVTVSPRPVAGVAMGTLGDNGSTFALYVRQDGTGAFLAYVRETKTVLVARNVVVGADRRFHFTAIARSSTNSGSDVEVDGALAPDGSVSGTLLGRAFSAPAATTAGATSTFAGFYEAGAANSSALGYTIVGADGLAYIVTVGPALAEAATIAINAAGILGGTTENNARITGTVQSVSGFIVATLVRGTGPTLEFAGADVEKRNDVEKLINLSTRSVISAGGSFTAGFVVTGTRPKPVLIRAIGPTLRSFQVEDALPAARLEVFRASTSLASANDWGTTSNASAIATTAQRVGAFALAPTSRDAALLLTLEPGNYSAQVSGQASANGVALVEVYDATEGAIARTERIINISTIAFAGAGSNLLTAGFYVSGSVPKRLLIRGAGPALAQFGLGGLLARPLVQVYSGSTILAENSGWSTSPDATAIAAAGNQAGAFPFASGSADAALLLNLAPGSYSAQLSGVGSATGTALIEIYELP